MSHYTPHVPAARGQPAGQGLKRWQVLVLSAVGLATAVALVLAAIDLGSVLYLALS